MGRICELHKLLQKRELSSRELTQSYLDAIRRDNASLGAYVNVTEEQALCAADNADKRIKENGKTILNFKLSAMETVAIYKE